MDVYDSQLYGVEQLGENQELTNDGFLICKNVPIARIGTLIYTKEELPELEASNDGLIRVTRTEEEVFSEAAIASFLGKPVTDNHPEDLISPETYKESKPVGVTTNVRRGVGSEADVLLADLLIYDHNMIELIRSNKRAELSCGYTSDYEQDEPGRAVQRNIRGNHVALVKQGRCGPRCAIKDHAVMPKKKITFKDLASIWKRSTGDEDLAEALIARPKGGAEDGEEVSPGTHIHIHTGGIDPVSKGEGSKIEDEESSEDPYEARFKGMEDSIKMLKDSFEEYKKGTVSEEHKDSKHKDESEKEEKKEEKEEEKEEKEEKSENKDASEVEEEGEEKEKKGETKDSVSLKSAWADSIARAEKLAPGLTSPTFDSKLPQKQTKDALCTFRRRALAAAFKDSATTDVVKRFVSSRQSVSTLPCAAVRIAFMAASDAAGELNNLRQRGSGADDSPAIRTNSLLRQMNENNRKIWNPGK